jgi:hypothetical protein
MSSPSAESRTFLLNSTILEPFEIGAKLLAIACYPATDENDALQKAAEALCADTIRIKCTEYPESAQQWRDAYPAYSAIDERESRRRLRTFSNRLQRRMLAARMSLGFFERAITGKEPRLPNGMKRHSLNELSKLVMEQTHQSVPENFEHRIWRPSRPVIHIAAAMQVIARASEPNSVAVGYPLDDLPLHRLVIEWAAFHEKMVLADPRFGVDTDQLVRVRLVN